MAKASPMVRSFNAGEFSELLDGRVDLDRYPASMHSLLNCIAAPQGPAIARSGTVFVAPISDETEAPALVPFVFSNEQATVLEFSSDRIRFLSEAGVQAYTSVAATVQSAAGAPVQIDAPGLAAEIGDEVALSGFPASYGLNSEIAKITAKTSDTYTLAIDYPSGVAVVNGSAARVYHVPVAYTEQQRSDLRYVQSVDVMYLLAPSARPKKLSRFGTYDWRLVDVEFVDGPFLPTNETTTSLTPSATGNALPNMTASNTPATAFAAASTNRPSLVGTTASPVDFLGRNITYTLAASQAYYAFDDNDDTYWAANFEQEGYVEIHLNSTIQFAVDGYTIYVAKDNQDTSYTSTDYAPSTFRLMGYNGTSWETIDEQTDYVLYEGGKSVFIELDNTTVYERYRLQVDALTRNGLIEPRVRRLVLRARDQASITFTASATEGINSGTGFQSTDVGRLLRVQGGDGAWRSCKITAVNSTTQVVASLLGEPLLDLKPIRRWRLGYWSDTTGWPATGDFFEDRFWLAGTDEYPDMFAGSVTGAYETFSQTDTFGEVLDDSAVVGRFNARRLSRIRWLSADARGLLAGTGSEEYTLSASSDGALTARNIRARPATRRGSADVEPVRVDDQVLYVQRSGRGVRELSFVYEAGGYKSPSMSQLASHLGTVQFVEMDYAAEPHSIIWMRRGDGSLVGLTYNRDENVLGWHRHDLAGGTVESLAVVPQSDQLQDALWVAVKRTVNGQERRYVERLTRFWDFDTELEDAHFVDSGLRYTGAEIETVYGLQHLEGETVYGLADELPVGPFTVQGGAVTLAHAASNIVLGLGFESVGVLPRLNNGAADGTAQGKVKRTNNISVAMWRSFGGQIGVYNEEEDDYVYERLEYEGNFSEFEDIELFTGIIGPFTPSPGYDSNGRLSFRRPKETPLPFNLVAIMPQMNTQDR